MDIAILHQTIAKHDAIGTDISHMFSLFNRKHNCHVYCDFLLNEELPALNKEQLKELMRDSRNLVVYHHSVYWEEGEELLKQSKARIIIKYHNITPPSFFEECDDMYFRLCKKGREQTLRLAKMDPNILWMSDSLFNLKEVRVLDSIRNKVIIPPFNNIREWRDLAPDDELLNRLIEDKHINLFFVGRVVPNKGHLFLLEIVNNFLDHYGDGLILHIAGRKEERLSSYYQGLDSCIEKFDLQSKVRFLGEISDAELLAYYLGCDFFICASLHEGFCVPLIESQSLCLPVIARKTSAISETVGKKQIILGEDVLEYSAAIKTLYQNARYRDFFVAEGLKNYSGRFENSVIEKKFIQAAEDFTAGKI